LTTPVKELLLIAFYRKAFIELSMRFLSKSLIALLLIFLALASVSLVVPAKAQSIPVPSVPQFTVYLVNHPYDVPSTSPTYTTDPYTGEQKQLTTGSTGYHADNVTIELWIRNQQSSYSNGTTTFTPYYDVRTKGHYEQVWTELDKPFKAQYSVNSNQTRSYIQGYYPTQPNSRYTVLTFSSTVPAAYYSTDIVTYPPNATVDFQVSTIIGHESPLIAYESHITIAVPYKTTGVAIDAQCDWSETQSITISNNSVLASTLQNPSISTATPVPLPTDIPTSAITATPTPTVPEVSWWVILPLLVSLFSVALLVRHRRDKYG
jgi:hypothetical protein